MTTLAGCTKFEETATTGFAAFLIYHNSCPEIPVAYGRFLESNETAMQDIIRCSLEEEALHG